MKATVDPWNCKPCWSTYYRIGVIVGKQLPQFATLQEIGNAFGISKQNAYTETVVALGKLCYRLKQFRKTDN